MRRNALLAPLALLSSAAAALNPLKVSGSNFVDSKTNERFEIIGMAYQPGGSAGFKPQDNVDPLTDKEVCLRDAILMQQLGVNTIRVYNLLPNVTHDDCASIFDAAGIYMIIDVNSPLPNGAIDAGEPWTTYDDIYLERIFQVVEAFKGYDNVLGFFGGNEIVNDLNSGKLDPPYIRAVTRDLKNYIAKHSDRTIPVGYSAADVREILFDTWAYLQCALDGDENDPSRIDFFGLNSYSWCGNASYTSAGYDQFVSGFANTTVPVFFSEYGCNKVQPRTFSEVGTIYGEQMRAVLSGGLVYEWTQEENDFGIITVNDNNTVSLRIDYSNLQTQFNKLDLKAIQTLNSTAASLKPPTCDASLIQDSGFNTNFTLPVLPPSGPGYISNGVQGAQGSTTSSVTDTKMPVTVYDANGKQVTGLALGSTSSGMSNAPSGSSTGSAPAASSSKAAAPPKEGVMSLGWLALLGLAMV